MVQRILRLFGSYDFFGKAIPGATVILGAWTLLPEGVIQHETIINGGFVNILSLFILLLIGGLTIGQGIHTFADNTEKIAKWILIRIVEVKQLYEISRLAKLVRVIRNGWRKSRLPTIPSDPDNHTGWKEFIATWNQGIKSWGNNRKWGIFDSFVSHRYLFAKWIQWNYAPPGYSMFDDRWEQGAKDQFLDSFVDSYENAFDDDIRNFEIADIESIYPLITARLSAHNIRGHRDFQSIYSFCRSMWVISIIFAIVYTFVLFSPFGDLGVLPYSPKIQSIPPQSSHWVFPAVAIGAWIVFLDAAGTYKKHYVEYLFASFTAQDDGEVDPGTRLTLDNF